MKKKHLLILCILLAFSLSTVAFITAKYVRAVKSFNTFYDLAVQTSVRIDSETALLEERISTLQNHIDTLQMELQTVTDERDQLVQQLSGLS